MEYKEDLRIQKTRRDLRNAVIEIVKKKNIEKVTVTEICDTAMINRMTFYKYYEDKYQLLDDTVQSFRDIIEEKMPNIDEVSTVKEAFQYCSDLISVIMNLLDENKDFVIAINKNGNNQIQKIVEDVSEDGLLKLFSKINDVKPLKFPPQFLAAFFYGGASSIIKYWIEHPDQMSQADVANVINDLRDDYAHAESFFIK